MRKSMMGILTGLALLMCLPSGVFAGENIDEINHVQVDPGHDGVVISWSPTAWVEEYIIYREIEDDDGPTGTFEELITLFGDETCSYEDATANEQGKSYSYKLMAAGTGGYVTPPLTVTYVACPKVKKVMPLSESSMEITWTEDEAAVGYEVFRQKDGSWEKIGSTGGYGANEYTDEGLTYGETYTYSVVSLFEDGSKSGHSQAASKKLSYEKKSENGYELYYDEDGALLTNVEKIIGPQSSYHIEVNKNSNNVTIYAKGEDGKYNLPVRAFICSTGRITPKGTFNISSKYRWHSLIHHLKGQWSTRIKGHFLFHSVPYTSQKITALQVKEYNLLGTGASSGCIRMTCEGVKWIYDNCRSKTSVRIYQKDEGDPLGIGSFDILPEWHNWDPTDPAAKNLCAEHHCH